MVQKSVMGPQVPFGSDFAAWPRTNGVVAAAVCRSRMSPWRVNPILHRLIRSTFIHSTSQCPPSQPRVPVRVPEASAEGLNGRIAELLIASGEPTILAHEPERHGNSP